MHMYTRSFFQTKSSGFAYLVDQIRTQRVLLAFGVLHLAQQKQKEGAGIPGGCSSPAKGWAKTSRMAPPRAQSSPPGKEDGGESQREGERGEETERA
jgi:hypothetical protein